MSDLNIQIEQRNCAYRQVQRGLVGLLDVSAQAATSAEERQAAAFFREAIASLGETLAEQRRRLAAHCEAQAKQAEGQGDAETAEHYAEWRAKHLAKALEFDEVSGQ